MTAVAARTSAGHRRLYRDAASVSIGQHLAARFRAVARC